MARIVVPHPRPGGIPSDGQNRKESVSVSADAERVTGVARPLVAEDVAGAAEESLRSLRMSAARLEELASLAEGLEVRASALTRLEAQLVERDVQTRDLETRAEELAALAAETEARRQHLIRDQRTLDQALADTVARDDELARREADLQSERERVSVAADQLSQERGAVEEAQSELQKRALDVEEREAAFAARWRRLLHAWSWRPRLPGVKARLCEFLLVPSSDGYKLLEQEGVALRRGSRLNGLLAEERMFVVTKIAPWSFDGRWCAYLQQEQP
jgi:chromosome segregation ATPase